MLNVSVCFARRPPRPLNSRCPEHYASRDPVRIVAALDIAASPNFRAVPEQAAPALHGLLNDNVSLPVARAELTRPTGSGVVAVEATGSGVVAVEAAGPNEPAPDLLLHDSTGSVTGREQYATNLPGIGPGTAATAAVGRLEDTLTSGLVDKLSSYDPATGSARRDVTYGRREIAAQVRPSRGGFNFDPYLDAGLFQRVLGRINATVLQLANEIRFYDSTGRLVYTWRR